MTIPDPIKESLSSWKHIAGDQLQADERLECDVVIVGTGAGGGMAAEVLAQAGLSVVMIEEGPLRSSSDFKMRESVAYPDLYQESAGRKTMDKAITLLQGRCVGGGTTVNWTSSFETPDQTLNHWGSHHGVKGCAPEEMAPYFERSFKRLNIHQWPVPPNANNEILRIGLDKMGWSHETMNRNVNGCINSGYCGMGCPVNAKQGMLLTTIPEAMKLGATLVTRTRAAELKFNGDKVVGLDCEALDSKGAFTTGRKVSVKAKHYVLSGGAIGSPGLLMRSGAPDPHGVLGSRTFIHPVVAVTALMPERVDPYYGAPQSIYSDEFLWKEGVTGPMGFKLEVPPLHPLLAATVLEGHGTDHGDLMKQFPYFQTCLVLMRDGFNEESTGGQVKLKADGTPGLDYQVSEYVFKGMRKALLTMAELQFAGGAREVRPMHRDARNYKTWAEAKAAIESYEMKPLVVRMFSAHVMGGCGMGEDPKTSVVNSQGRHHQLENVSVIDGSVFPTSIGTNPQVSIYGMSLKNAEHLVGDLKG